MQKTKKKLFENCNKLFNKMIEQRRSWLRKVQWVCCPGNAPFSCAISFLATPSQWKMWRRRPHHHSLQYPVFWWMIG
jgi:hypothetical protein